jgi:Ca2+-binding EF-hand superfamily protein
MDKNSDGFLSLEEVKEVVKTVQPAMEEKELKVLLDSGPIGPKCDEASFRKAMTTKCIAPHTKDELMAAFKVFDPEGKGKIAKDEMTPILEILGEFLITEGHRKNFLTKMFRPPNEKEVTFDTFVDYLMKNSLQPE